MSGQDEAPDGFLSRWSRRKALVREGATLPEPTPVADAPPPPAQAVVPAEPPAADPVLQEMAPPSPPPPPTLDDVARLELGSDFRRFVAPDVTPEVKNAALKKLFADPQFNLMDGLDTYIDDYGKPDPIPSSMLRRMVQSKLLGLFDDEEADEAAKTRAGRATPDGAATVVPPQSPPEPMPPIANDQDPAVRLQPLDAAGPDCDPGGAGEDAGRER